MSHLPALSSVMDLRRTGYCFVLTLVVLVALSHFTDGFDIPMDFDKDTAKMIEENFMKHISDDLKTKLKKKADEGMNLDLDNLDSADLTDDEKKQLENALKEALAPLFGEFVQMMAKSGIPGEIKKFMDGEKPNDTKQIEEEEQKTENSFPDTTKKESCANRDSKNKETKCEAEDDKTQKEPKEEL